MNQPSPIKIQSWQHPRICVNCNTVLYSRYVGEFVGCPCGNAVDQTEYYERVIGDMDILKSITDTELINYGFVREEEGV